MILVNKIQCLLCEDIIISRHRHDYVSCECGEVSVDGGNSYARRSFKTPGSYKNLTVTSDHDFEVIRENFERLDKGKSGLEIPRWVKLKDMSTEWLETLTTGGFDWHFEKSGFNPYRLELEYRKQQ